MTEFSYTDRGQIRQARVADGTVWRYGYDAFGRRVWKSHVDRAGRILDSVVFAWDGDDLIGQTNLAHTARGGVGAGGSSTWVWTHHPVTGEVLTQDVAHSTPEGGGAGGAESGGVGGWGAARVDAECYAIVADLAQAPTELVNPDTGVVAGQATTTVWGRTRWSGVGTDLRFAGQ